MAILLHRVYAQSVGSGWRTHIRTISLASCILTAGALVSTGPAFGAVITPTTTVDQFNSDPTQCSLREAVQAANDDSAAMAPGCSPGTFPVDTIRLAPGIYELTLDGATGEGNESGDLNFFAEIEIEAIAGGPVVIDANGIDRVVRFSGSLALRGISVTGGFVNDPNPGSGITGGGISTSGGSELSITNGAVFGNSADSLGGGISASGPTTLTNVTVSGNTTTELAGGGIEVSSSAGASLALDHVTIANNQSLADDPAQSIVTGGLLVSAPTAIVRNSIIAGNTDADSEDDAPDCQGPVTSAGGNVIGDTEGCTYTSAPSDSTGSPALLAALTDNGGFTRTHALLTGSPALERGLAPCAPTDQRGYPRPSPAGATCDAGAYELFACAGVPLNAAGPFAGCPTVFSPPPEDLPTKKKCKRKKKGKRAATAGKRKCKKKKRR